MTLVLFKKNVNKKILLCFKDQVNNFNTNNKIPNYIDRIFSIYLEHLLFYLGISDVSPIITDAEITIFDNIYYYGIVNDNLSISEHGLNYGKYSKPTNKSPNLNKFKLLLYSLWFVKIKLNKTNDVDLITYNFQQVTHPKFQDIYPPLFDLDEQVNYCGELPFKLEETPVHYGEQYYSYVGPNHIFQYTQHLNLNFISNLLTNEIHLFNTLFGRCLVDKTWAQKYAYGLITYSGVIRFDHDLEYFSSFTENDMSYETLLHTFGKKEFPWVTLEIFSFIPQKQKKLKILKFIQITVAATHGFWHGFVFLTGLPDNLTLITNMTETFTSENDFIVDKLDFMHNVSTERSHKSISNTVIKKSKNRSMTLDNVIIFSHTQMCITPPNEHANGSVFEFKVEENYLKGSVEGNKFSIGPLNAGNLDIM